MRINLKSNFDIGEASKTGTMELETQNATLRALLEELGHRSEGKLGFINPATNEVDEADFVISVNGREYPFLPDGLDVRLRDGDVVEIMVVMFGGG